MALFPGRAAFSSQLARGEARWQVVGVQARLRPGPEPQTSFSELCGAGLGEVGGA